MGSPEAFWDLLGPEISWIHRQLRRLGVREPDLDDVTQDVLVQLYRRWDAYDDTRPLRAWVFGFCFRVSSVYRKRPQYERQVLLPELDRVDDGPDAEQELGLARDRALVIAALDGVGDGRREVFVMVDLEERGVPEAAEVLGIPLNTAYSRLRKARQEFTAAVRKLRPPCEAAS